MIFDLHGHLFDDIEKDWAEVAMATIEATGERRDTRHTEAATRGKIDK
jgi:hypothetical protein